MSVFLPYICEEQPFLQQSEGMIRQAGEYQFSPIDFGDTGYDHRHLVIYMVL